MNSTGLGVCGAYFGRRPGKGLRQRSNVFRTRIASIQTFGSFANFHPHVHALVTDGVVTEDGTFLSLLEPDLDAVAELFRHLLLAALRWAGRLSESFHDRLLGWSPSGFLVHGRHVAHADEPAKLERLARYIARAPLSLGKIHETSDGRIRVETPPDPRTGARGLVLDVMEFIHRVTTQIPDAPAAT